MTQKPMGVPTVPVPLGTGRVEARAERRNDVLLTIDPSVAADRTGWAIFDDHTLVAAGHESPPPAWFGSVTHALVEVPRIYPHGRTPNPNDIVKLALAAGELVGVLRAFGVETLTVEPRAWKRTLEKSTCCRRVWGKLREDERYTAAEYEPEPKGDIRGGKDHVLDAIGIGLWRLGRLA